MTDKEKIELIAREVMGWISAPRKTYSFVDSNKEIIRENYWWEFPVSGARVEQNKWNPFESWDEAGMVSEALAMRMGNGSVEISICSASVAVGLIDRSGKRIVGAKEDTAPRAICEAAVEWAMEVVRERER
jgi:hypothetical protein